MSGNELHKILITKNIQQMNTSQRYSHFHNRYKTNNLQSC